MDKASIIKDAIDYIQELQEQERRMLEEISELESAKEDRVSIGDTKRDDVQHFTQRRKKKKRTSPASPLATGSPNLRSIEVMEVISLPPCFFLWTRERVPMDGMGR